MRRLVRSPTSRALVAALLSVAVCAGCAATRPLPSPLPAPEVVKAVDRNAGRFYTLKDTHVGLRIRTPAGSSPGMGGVIVYDRLLPGIWLRAEKLGRLVFSLKVLGSQFWLAIPDTREVITGGEVAYARLPVLVRPGEIERMLAGPDDLGLTWSETEMSVEGEFYRFEVPVLGGRYAEVLVDRREHVVRAIRRYDAAGRVTTQVHLDGYRPVLGKPFPHRLMVLRFGGRVQIQLTLGKPTLDDPIPAAAFRPNPRPGWRVVDLDREPLSEVKAFSEE